VVVRVESLTAPKLYSRAGLMAREDLSPDSRHVFFLVFPDNRPRHANTSAYEFQYRAKKGGDSKGINPPQDATPPPFPVGFPYAWLRMKRVGNEFTRLVSAEGKTWKTYGSYSLDLPATVFLGLAVTSHPADTSTTASFKDLGTPGSTG
jgi:hypothetical protein